MAAYNYIRFEMECPNCRKDAEIEAQCHIASSFDGDESGLFRNHAYRIGEKMRWWPKSDPRWHEWRNDGWSVHSGPDKAIECCYSECKSCRADLFALICFVDVTPIRVQKVGLQENWPAGYPK